MVGGSRQARHRVRLHTPEPGQDVRGKHCNSRTSGDTGQGLLGARFSMRELVAAHNDGNQACDLGDSAREEGLHCGEAGIER